MLRQMVQRVSGLIRDLWQRLQHLKTSPPQFNSRNPAKRPKPQAQAGKKR